MDLKIKIEESKINNAHFHIAKDAFNAIIQDPQALDSITGPDLNIVYQHLKLRKALLLKMLLARLSGESKYINSGSYKHLNHAKQMTEQFGINYAQLEHWFDLVELKMLHLGIDLFNNQVFADSKSHVFFDKVFTDWLKEEANVNAIHYVYRRLWIRNSFKELGERMKLIDYTIKCRPAQFGIFWNENYAPLQDYRNKIKAEPNGQVKIKTFDQIGLNTCEKYHSILSQILLV